MDGAAIFLIILLIVIVLVGVGVGLWLWYREKQKKKDTDVPGPVALTGPNIPGFMGLTGPNGIIFGPTGLTGANIPGQSGSTGSVPGPTGPGNIPGPTGLPSPRFSISPVSDSSQYLTFQYQCFSFVGCYNQLLVSDLSSTLCADYSWQYVPQFNNGTGIVPNALVSNLNTNNTQPFSGRPQPNLVVKLNTLSGRQTGLFQSEDINGTNLQTWEYDSNE